ncbi:MAG: FtsX-like permease family protein [Candidatus Thorarchaeota archaeon]
MFLLSRLMSQAPQVALTLVVFSLASGVLGGVLIYMDSAGPDVLDDLTENVDIDMQITFTYPYYEQSNFTTDDAYNITLHQEGVSHIENVTVIQSYAEYRQQTFLGVDESFFSSFTKSVVLDGDSQDLSNSTCFLSRFLIIEEGLEIGDNYTATTNQWEYNSSTEEWIEIEISQEYIIAGTFESNLFLGWNEWDEDRSSSLSIITARTGLEQSFLSIGYGQYEALAQELWVKFDRTVVMQSGATAVNDLLKNVERRIEQTALPYLQVTDFELLAAVYEYSAWYSGMTVIAVSFSIPTIVMGIILVQYNTALIADENRRDVGTVKTRGASGWQAFKWVLGNASVVGIIGSFGAVLTGVIGSLLSGSVIDVLQFDLTLLSEFHLVLSPYVIIGVFVYSFLIGFFLTLPQAVKALLMTPTEAHSILEKDILTEKEKMGSVFPELLALAFSGYILSVFILMFSFSGIYSINTYSIFMTLGPVLVVFVLAFIRLVSRPASSVKTRVFSRFKKPPLAVGAKLIGRTAGFYKKSEALGVMFIALVFTAAALSSVGASTGTNHVSDLCFFDIGAEIVIDVKQSVSNVTIDLLENITAVDGVEDASGIFVSDAQISYREASWTGDHGVNRSITIVGVQPEEWLASAFWLPYFTLSDMPENSVSQLGLSNTSILSSFKPIDHYAIGFLQMRYPVYSDQVNLGISGPNETIWSDCTIVDVMCSNLDGYGSTYIPGEPYIRDFVIVDLDYLHDTMHKNQINKIYVRMEEGANRTIVMKDLFDIAPGSFKSVESPYDDIDTVLTSRMGQTVLGTYTLNIIFSILYLTLGVAIVSAIKGRKLRKQFSILRALGTEFKSIVTPVLIDTAVTIMLASLIGVVLGVVLAYLISMIPLFFMGSVTTLAWTTLPVTLVIPLFLLGGVLGGSIAFALLANYIVSKRILTRNIAEEIQYTE